MGYLPQEVTPGQIQFATAETEGMAATAEKNVNPASGIKGELDSQSPN
ncbi:MAG: hypothetical protein O7C66_05435 [Alphaproteobacteria bacterium]|nr:hypothetical protein [Alphaproteobacteria bacterium]